MTDKKNVFTQASYSGTTLLSIISDDESNHYFCTTEPPALMPCEFYEALDTLKASIHASYS